MLEFIFGIMSGIYIGTYYECKPTLQKIGKYLKTYFPPKDKKKGFF